MNMPPDCPICGKANDSAGQVCLACVQDVFRAEELFGLDELEGFALSQLLPPKGACSVSSYCECGEVATIFYEHENELIDPMCEFCYSSWIASVEMGAPELLAEYDAEPQYPDEKG